jgi:hypothetical protein
LKALQIYPEPAEKHSCTFGNKSNGVILIHLVKPILMNDTYSVKVDNTHLMIIRNNEDESIWEKGIKFLKQIRKDDGHNFSEVIMQLSEKSWANINLLYEVAAYIQQYHPNNEIDWFATFKFAEHLDNLNQSFDLKQKFEKKKQSTTDETFDYIKFASEIEKDERNQSEEIVKQKLGQYKLPFKTK